jgi:hypothetical protein
MIYKFECKEINFCNLEVELRDENVVFTIEEQGSLPLSIFLNKKDIYHLIGALHLIQKEIR